MKHRRVPLALRFTSCESSCEAINQFIDAFRSQREPRRAPRGTATPRGLGVPALLAVLMIPRLVIAQTSGSGTQPIATRDLQAVIIANQSLQALTGGTAINDLTLQGRATYTAGSDIESGTVTLLAGGNLASRVTLSLTNGQRTEIRNGPAGDWIGTDGVEHAMALHNCWPEAAWFYPGLSLQALSTDPGLAVLYVGLENNDGRPVQHLRVSRVLAGQTADSTALIQRLSTMEMYLDAGTYLPLFLDFNLHADDDLNLDIPVEIAFSGYQKMNGIAVPMRIQKYLNGSLLLDLTISSAAINSGLPPSAFAVTSTVAPGGAL